MREEKGAFTLVVLLQNRVQVEVPGLDKATVDSIFDAHARYAEASETEILPSKNPFELPFNFSMPLKSDGPIDSLGMSMQHNPEQADLPPMPDEVLNKITTIARAFGLEDTSALPKPEPDCNCIYCQVSRSLHGEPKLEKSASNEEEVITEDDLKFRNWDVKQAADKLYTVTNPLDENEYYSVFLGEPLGCTCGQKNCEHIRAVLNT